MQPCEVSVFDGDYSSWSTFRDLFTAIYINNNRLCGVEKLCYLFQKTSGDARVVNRNSSIVEGNFEIAWENLRTRYENKRVLFNKQLHNLYSMQACPGENPDEIK